MKFGCPKCGKKYSLPDEKVPVGKDFKVRCKKCGEAIILHGKPKPQEAESTAFEEEPTRVFDYSKMSPAQSMDSAIASQLGGGAPAQQEEPQWHVAIDGEQRGPYTDQQIRDMLKNGNIDEETYLWRDGFEDWRTLKEVPEFQSESPSFQSPMPAQEQPPVEQSPYGMPAHEEQLREPQPEQAQPSDRSLFSEAFVPKTEEAPAQQSAPETSTRDLFSPRPSGEEMEPSPFEAGEKQDIVTSSPATFTSPRVDASSLKAARHEDSVLFSLQSLQALASSSREPAKMQTTATGGGSGLIDIKSLTGGAAGGAAEPSMKTDDILNIGGAGFGAPVGMPSLLQPAEKKSNVLFYILGGVGGFSLIAITVLLVGIFGLGWGRGKSEQTTPQISEEELKAKLLKELQQSTLAPQAKTGGQIVAKAEQTQQPAIGEEVQEGKKESAAKEEKKKPGSRKSGRKKNKGSGSGGSDILSVASSKETTKKTSGGAKSLLDLIDEATSKRKKGESQREKTSKKSSPGGASGSNLPDKPTKSDIISAMKKITPKVKKCARGQTGTATVSFIIAGPTGKVKTAKVIAGPFQGTPAAACIASAVKSATFPKFKKPKFTVTYPFVIR